MSEDKIIVIITYDVVDDAESTSASQTEQPST